MGSCKCGSNDCGNGLSRRQFLKNTGAGAVALAAMEAAIPAMAGPFSVDDFEKLVPADKKLSAAWIQSLYERGEAEWYSGEDLKHIGMPVGGICCGHVYLSGDGRLWHWDIFNQGIGTSTSGTHYSNPMPTENGIDLGFTIRVKGAGKEMTRVLDGAGFSKVRFRGAYPMGFVEYDDDRFPVNVSLEAFSPFTPLDVDGSSLPLTVMRYTVRNTSTHRVGVSLVGVMANPVLLHSGNAGVADYVNTTRYPKGATCVQFTAEKRAPKPTKEERPDVVFDDFESDSYENWTVEGTAFGSGPIVASEMPGYQGDVGAHGDRIVNSHNTRQGENVGAGDAHIGVLMSKPFRIVRRYIHALIGGGSDAERTSLSLLIDDKVVAKLAGKNNNAMQRQSFSVEAYQGQVARLRIVDEGTGGWGNIGVDHIVFSDRPAVPSTPVDERRDMGDMTLAILEQGEGVFYAAKVPDGDAAMLFTSGPDTARSASAIRPRGAVGKSLSLAPGEEATVSFAIAWRFPNHPAPVGKGHYYAERFTSSLAVVEQLAAHGDGIYARTRLWHDTWYDSTLPHWLLDRTFVNTSTLATSTCLRMEGGRFWGWEGVGCCFGTCSHVWHYAQAVGRVFPELERITRENVDYGLAYQPDGSIWYRADFPDDHARHEAIDGQCGTILRVYREHTMSPNDAFLRRIWPRVKGSIQYLIKQDGDGNGVLEGKQMNTLDASWYGPISWLSSLYIGALRAGSVMAREMGDDAFAKGCDTLAQRGGKWVSENLFDGEYFYHKRDPEHPEAFGSGIGCHIDQVFGQGWAHQLGLGRILPRDKTRSALKALWRYNFTPDVGPYRAQYKTGRWYAMPGEAGLIMCTFPKGGEREARGGKPTHGFAGYFNECMNGFEYQAAGHMIAEGLVQEGLTVTRAIHDRYHPSRRNPYNEIECGDHYARSMASYGVFLTLCGFTYHGPNGHLGFAPRMKPKDFRAPFTAAEGWGTFAQRRTSDTQHESITMKWGKLRLRSLAFVVPENRSVRAVTVRKDDEPLPSAYRLTDTQVTLDLDTTVTLEVNQTLTVILRY
jgi:non-lysosomal glucosylceramidase